MRKDDTTGEYAIPNVEARAASRTDELPMDSDAFAGFYQRSAPALRAYLVRVSGNTALADDLMQESYLRFLCATQPGGRRSQLPALSVPHCDQSFAGSLAAAARRRASKMFLNTCLRLATRLSRIDSQVILDPAMARMRPRDRQLLWLAHAEGYSHREIAEITGLGAAEHSAAAVSARGEKSRACCASRSAPIGGQDDVPRLLL